jgi:uncharacterized protein
VPRASHSVHLLVDGYNIIGAWPELLPDGHDRTFFDTQPLDLEAAREKLIAALANFSAFEGYLTQIVFDAHSRDEPAYEELIGTNLSVYYTEFRETADTYIERFCANFRTEAKLKRARSIVATNDRILQQTITGFGAEWLSARQLIDLVEKSSRQTRRRLQSQPKSSSRFLFDSLDPAAKAHLTALRFGRKPDT